MSGSSRIRLRRTVGTGAREDVSQAGNWKGCSHETPVRLVHLWWTDFFQSYYGKPSRNFACRDWNDMNQELND